jgi:hypothetical protein
MYCGISPASGRRSVGFCFRPAPTRVLLLDQSNRNPTRGLSCGPLGRHRGEEKLIGRTIQAVPTKDRLHLEMSVLGSWRSMERTVRALTYLVVVVFGGVYNRDIPGFQGLARGLKTAVQLLGNAKSSGSLSVDRLKFRMAKGGVIACDHDDVAGRTSPDDQNFVLVLGWWHISACPSYAIYDGVTPHNARDPPYWEHDHLSCFDAGEFSEPSQSMEHENLFALMAQSHLS